MRAESTKATTSTTASGVPTSPTATKVLHGAARAFSLRDAREHAYATILTEKFQPYLSGAAQPARAGHLGPDRRRGGHYDPRAWRCRRTAPRFDAGADRPRRHRCQIKSHYNSPVREEHRPYVQDFVNHQPWGHGRRRRQRPPRPGCPMTGSRTPTSTTASSTRPASESSSRGRGSTPTCSSGGHDNSIAPDRRCARVARRLRTTSEAAHARSRDRRTTRSRRSSVPLKRTRELGGIDQKPDPAHGRRN